MIADINFILSAVQVSILINKMFINL
jgi:hypothetical protein